MSEPLTEKTLELNIMAELAFLGRIAGYQPYFIGFSQWDELSHGVDSSYSAGALIGLFQFKRGYPRSQFFTFYINNNRPHFDQHETFSRTDASSGACRYILPLIGTNQDVYRHRGNLLAMTPCLSPQVFGLLSPADEPHRVRMYPSGTWRLYSDFREGEWRNIYQRLPKDTPSLERFPEQFPKDLQERARQVIDSLQLPRIQELARTRVDVGETSMRRLLDHRSTYCMVFDKD